MAALVDSGRKASAFCGRFEPLPQILRKVRVSGAEPLQQAGVRAANRDGEARIAGNGRVLIRPSGTEPLIRVMAEREDETTLVSDVVDTIVAALERATA